MKFSFINPSPSPDTLEMCSIAWPPLGIFYCASVLMKAGIEVSILDQAAQGFSLKNTLEWVNKEDPDILGFSALHKLPDTIQHVKDDNPHIPIVLGNYYATFNAERILQKYPFIDVIVRGEGEHTCLELARCLEKGGRLSDIKGITYRDNGKIVSTPTRPLIEEVDSLPFPERNLTDTPYTSTILGVKVATKKFTTMLSARGCLYQCKFCVCRRITRGIWRPRSVENIIKELELIHSEGYKQLLFVDDTFTLDPKRIMKLCKEIRRQKIDIEWFCDSRVNRSRYDLLRQMVKAGCKSVYFGIESANQRILNYYQKGISPDQSKRAVQNARRAGVDVIVGSFIVGAPDETNLEIQNTLRFIDTLDVDAPSVNILRAFPGTDLWDELVENGDVDPDRCWETGVYVPNVSPNAVPFDVIRSLISSHYRILYLHPKKLLRELLRTVKSPFRLGAVLNNITRFNSIARTVREGVVLNY